MGTATRFAMSPDSSLRGHNPMRWDCEGDGCFNIKRRPKIEVFAECFPRKINFGDVDGLVEINGRFCLLEWKGEGGELKTGQRITYEAFTRLHGNAVFLVEGDAEHMTARRYSIFWNGVQGNWVRADLDSLKGSIRGWAKLARALKFAKPDMDITRACPAIGIDKAKDRSSERAGALGNGGYALAGKGGQ